MSPVLLSQRILPCLLHVVALLLHPYLHAITSNIRRIHPGVDVMATSDLRSLTKEIKRVGDIIESYALDQDVPQGRVFQIKTVPQEVQAARTRLIDLSEQLSKLANPDVQLTNLRNNTYFNGCLHFILHYRIHKHVPVLGHMTFRELGRITEVDEALCSRILRAAMALDFFAEPESGVVSHSYLTQRLAEDDSLAAILETRLEEAFPAF